MTSAKKPDRAAFRLYTLHSQKGGVGKTSLAIAIAALEATFGGRKTLILDTDMTGTCIGDALGDNPDGYSRGRWLNDIMLSSPDAFLSLVHPGSYSSAVEREYGELWKMIRKGRKFGNPPRQIDYIPSNPGFHAVCEMVPCLAQETALHFFSERMHDVVVAAGRMGYEAVIMDLPPGMFGLSVAAYRVATDGHLQRDLSWTLNDKEASGAARKDAPRSLAIIVTTTDPPDYRAAFSTIMQLDEDLCLEEPTRNTSRCRLWFNKAIERDPVSAVGAIFDDMSKVCARDDKEISRVGSLPSRHDRVVEHRKRVGAGGGARIMRFVQGFRTADICGYVASLHPNKGRPRMANIRDSSPSGWVEAVWALLEQAWAEEGTGGQPIR